MNDLISRQANERTYKLNNGQEVTFHYNDDGIGLATIEFMDAIFERLNNSVEVVRCKDCKYGHLRDNTKRNSSIYCDFGIGVYKENYCSFGERKE